MKVSEIIEALSPEAKALLEGMGSSQIGRDVPYRHRWDLLGELQRAGVAGERGGLTIKGSAVAEKLQNASLDAVFGRE